jgi:hypothetical protein
VVGVQQEEHELLAAEHLDRCTGKKGRLEGTGIGVHMPGSSRDIVVCLVYYFATSDNTCEAERAISA